MAIDPGKAFSSFVRVYFVVVLVKYSLAIHFMRGINEPDVQGICHFALTLVSCFIRGLFYNAVSTSDYV
jgi:hypothetical protein